MTNGAKTNIGRWGVETLSTNGAGKTGCLPSGQWNQISIFHPYTKINLKWIKDINLKWETLKLRNKAIDNTLQDTGAGENFLNKISHTGIRSQYQQMGPHETKFLYCLTILIHHFTVYEMKMASCLLYLLNCFSFTITYF